MSSKCLIDIYSNAQSCIQLNGKYTESFLCNVGVRQGCPLSPVLFTLYIHDLLDEMRNFAELGLGDYVDSCDAAGRKSIRFTSWS